MEAARRPEIRLDRRWLAGCLVLAAALRVFRLGHQSLWIDELISLQLATYTQGIEFWRGLLVDIHGPFTSMLLHGWTRFGEGEAWLRLLYAIASLATIPVMYRLAADLFGSSAGKAAALLLAVSPFHVWYAQEIRNYAWFILWVTIALVHFVRVWDGLAARSDWVLLSVALALAVLTNFSAAFLLVALTVALALRRPFPRAMLAGWAGVLAFVGLVFLPWFLDWFQRIGGDRIFVSSPPPMGVPLREGGGFSLVEVPFTLWSFTYGYSLGPSLRSLHLDRTAAALLSHAPVFALGFAAVVVPVALGFREAATGGRGRRLLVATLLLAPTALAIVLAARGIKTFHPRYLVVAFPPYVALLGLGWSRGGRLVRATAAVAAGLTLVALGQYYFDPEYAKEDCRSAARLVRELEEPGDSVVVIYAFRPFRHYFADTAAGRARLLHVHKRFLRTDDEMRAHVADARGGSGEDGEGGRVWLVLTRWWDVAPQDRIRRIFEETLLETGDWDFPGVKVLLYEEARA